MAPAPPSNPTLISDFSGSSTPSFPAGFDALWNGDVAYHIDGSGHFVPVSPTWASFQYKTPITRDAGNIYYILEFSSLPAVPDLQLMQLSTAGLWAGGDPSASVLLRWSRDSADFQLTSFSGGSFTFRDGADEVDVAGTIGPGFKIAITTDATSFSIWVSTDGGTVWQNVGDWIDGGSFLSGSIYAGNECAGSGVIDAMWFGAFTDPTPTITAGTLAASASGTTTTVTLPSHQADDILLVGAMYQAGANLTISSGQGWAPVTGYPENNANESTAWWWKRATSSSEPNPVVTSSSAASTSNGRYATAFRIRGCATTGTPFEDPTSAGPSLDTTPDSSAIDTIGDNRLAAAFALLDDDNTVSSGFPPSGWDTVTNQSSTTGGDHRILAMSKKIPSPANVPAAVFATMSASDYWKSLTLAFVPPSLAPASVEAWNVIPIN
jgi:hypothetical protein